MRSTRSIVGASFVALAFLASACGGGTGPAASATPRGAITVGGFNFSESTTLANVYGQALEAKGYKVTIKAKLGTREIVAPALERGDIDLYPGYAATDLEFYNNKAGEASSDVQATVAKLRDRLQPKGIKALDPSTAVDINGIVVTKATADKFNLKKISDLTPVANQLRFGTTPECDKRPFCLPGLQRVYGITFKEVKPLDSVGPITRTALERGDVDVALLLSTDGAIAAKGWVLLDDDKHLQRADNVIPIIKASAANDEVTRLLNQVSAKLTTDGLIKLNRATDVDKQDADAVAKKWLQDNGFLK